MFWSLLDPNTSLLFVRINGNLVFTEISILFWVFVIIGVLMSITIHEFAHAYFAYKLGDNTAKINDRMNLNPVNHFDVIGLAMIMLLGFGYGKPVPVDLSNLENPKRDYMLISLAGPLSNVLIALICGVIFILFSSFVMNGDTSSLNGIINGILSTFIYSLPQIGAINLALVIFNLLPVPPLDGSKIFAYFSYKIEEFIDYISPYSIFILLGLILPILNGQSILSLIISPFMNVYLNLLN